MSEKLISQLASSRASVLCQLSRQEFLLFSGSLGCDLRTPDARRFAHRTDHQCDTVSELFQLEFCNDLTAGDAEFFVSHCGGGLTPRSFVNAVAPCAGGPTHTRWLAVQGARQAAGERIGRRGDAGSDRGAWACRSEKRWRAS